MYMTGTIGRAGDIVHTGDVGRAGDIYMTGDVLRRYMTTSCTITYIEEEVIHVTP